MRSMCVTKTVVRRQLLGSCDVRQKLVGKPTCSSSFKIATLSHVPQPPEAAALASRGVKRCSTDSEIDSWFMGQDRKRAKIDCATGLKKLDRGCGLKKSIDQDLGVRARVSGQRPPRVVKNNNYVVEDIIKGQDKLFHQLTKGSHAKPSRPAAPASRTESTVKKPSRQQLRESSRLALDEIEKNSNAAFEDNCETMREMHMLMYGSCSHQEAADAKYDALGIDYLFK